MDSEFWTTRLAAAKRQFNMQHHQHHVGHHTQPTSQMDRYCVEDIHEVEEDFRPDFPCPYCFEEFDLGFLCSHLEDEHSGESKASVCPVCLAKVSRDMLSHITLQHGNLFKLPRRRRLRRVAVPNSQALSLLGRDLREAHLQILLAGGSGSHRSNSTTTSSNAATDPFLSSLVYNFSSSETDEISKSVMSSIEDNSSKKMPSQHIWKSSFDPSLSREEREQRMRQAAGRAVFVQDILASTLLAD